MIEWRNGEITITPPEDFQKVIRPRYIPRGASRGLYINRMSVTKNGQTTVVTFEKDGDAYITAPTGKVYFTEYKIVSAQPVLLSKEFVGFSGINTVGEFDELLLPI